MERSPQWQTSARCSQPRRSARWHFVGLNSHSQTGYLKYCSTSRDCKTTWTRDVLSVDCCDSSASFPQVREDAADLLAILGRRDWRPNVERIEKPIAEDVWSFRTTDGTKHRSRIIVGRPSQNPNNKNGDWYVPLSVEGLHDRVTCIFGVGPVDALMNAGVFVKQLFAAYSEVTPRTRVTK